MLCKNCYNRPAQKDSLLCGVCKRTHKVEMFQGYEMITPKNAKGKKYRGNGHKENIYETKYGN